MSHTIDRNHYDQDYYQLHLRRLETQDRFTRVKLRRVNKLLEPRQGEVVLDLGTGVGTILLWMLKQELKAIGLDYSSTSLRLVRKLIPSFAGDRPFAGVCADGQAFPLRDKALDAVVAIDFTEHLDDQTLANTTSEVFRALKPGGRFVIYTPNPSHIFEILKDRNLILKQDPSHIGLRSMGEYRRILQEAGFAISQAYYEPTHIPVWGGIESILMRIPGVGACARRRICIRAEKTVS